MSLPQDIHGRIDWLRRLAAWPTRVFLDLHVKVKSEWRNDERALDEINLQNRSSQ